MRPTISGFRTAAQPLLGYHKRPTSQPRPLGNSQQLPVNQPCRFRAAQHSQEAHVGPSRPSINQHQSKSPVACSAASAASDAGASQGHPKGLLSWASILWAFSRPHTMIGTALSLTSISLLALQSQPGLVLDTSVAVTAWLQALVSALLMNISIVGINQLSDVEIDKINKPYLPLASGALTSEAGTVIVVTTAIASLAIGLWSGSTPLIATLSVSLALGIVYSCELPFMRWKRSPVLAAACILVVRALCVQLGFFYHTLQGALDVQTFSLTPAITFTLCFMLFFSVVIALFKDIPDAKGDDRAGLRTLTVQLGVKSVFWTCIWLLTAAYMGAAFYSLAAAGALGGGLPGAASLSMSSTTVIGPRTWAAVAGHALLAAALWRRALVTNLSSTKDISECYMHVWKLFYAEYILIPLLL